MFDLPMSPMFGGGDNIWDEPDIVLTYIVTALVNGMGLEMGVTLMARGLVISGTLISERAYLENMTNLLREQVAFTDPNIPDEVKESLKDMLDLRSLGEFDIMDYVDQAVMEAMDADSEDNEDDFDEDDEDFDDFEFDEDEMPPVMQYIHLKDPMVVAGEPPINFDEGANVVMRLRMTSIDGWMLGKLTPDMPAFFDLDNDDVKH